MVNVPARSVKANDRYFNRENIQMRADSFEAFVFS